MPGKSLAHGVLHFTKSTSSKFGPLPPGGGDAQKKWEKICKTFAGHCMFNSKCQKLVFVDISFYGQVWLTLRTIFNLFFPTLSHFKLQLLYTCVSSFYYHSVTIMDSALADIPFIKLTLVYSNHINDKMYKHPCFLAPRPYLCSASILRTCRYGKKVLILPKPACPYSIQPKDRHNQSISLDQFYQDRDTKSIVILTACALKSAVYAVKYLIYYT